MPRMKQSTYEPIRSWDEVFECIDHIVADPRGNTELIKALNINLRVVTGSLPGYQGSGFAEKKVKEHGHWKSSTPSWRPSNNRAT